MAATDIAATGLSDVNRRSQLRRAVIASTILIRRRLSSRIMPHSENERPLRERNASKHCARDVAGITVSCMRHQAGSYSSRRRLCISFGVLVNESGQFGGIGGIEASSDCGKAKHTAEPRITQASKVFL